MCSAVLGGDAERGARSAAGSRPEPRLQAPAAAGEWGGGREPREEEETGGGSGRWGGGGRSEERGWKMRFAGALPPRTLASAWRPYPFSSRPPRGGRSEGPSVWDLGDSGKDECRRGRVSTCGDPGGRAARQRALRRRLRGWDPSSQIKGEGASWSPLLSPSKPKGERGGVLGRWSITNHTLAMRQPSGERVGAGRLSRIPRSTLTGLQGPAESEASVSGLRAPPAAARVLGQSALLEALKRPSPSGKRLFSLGFTISVFLLLLHFAPLRAKVVRRKLAWTRSSS